MKRMENLNLIFLMAARPEGNRIIQILSAFNCRFLGPNTRYVYDAHSAVGILRDLLFGTGAR